MSDKPIIEFGNHSIASGRMSDDMIEGFVLTQSRVFTDPLRWISDIEWLDEPRVVSSPNRADLYPFEQDRFRSYGWYARFASEGYGELEKYFSCHSEHVPSVITLAWLGQMIERYVAQSQGEDDD